MIRFVRFVRSVRLAWLPVALMFLGVRVYGALPAATAWEVQPGVGADTKGGCFVTGSSGTDFTINAGAYNFTDLVAVTNNTVSSASHNFVAADVGNCLQITAGTGYTTGFYYIVSVAANVATLDRNVGTAPLTGGTFAVGGALATIGQALTANTAGNRIFVKATGTISVASSVINLNNNLTPLNSAPSNYLVGYTSTRGDNGRVNITATANNLLVIDGNSAAGWVIQNFNIDCASGNNTYGVRTGTFTKVINVKVSNFGVYGITAANNSEVTDSEVTGGVSGCVDGINMQSDDGFAVFRSYVHDNLCTGIRFRRGGVAIWNVISNNTGASSDGIEANENYNVRIFNNVLWGNGRDGFFGNSIFLTIIADIRNNIIGSNGRYGINGNNAAGAPAFPTYDGNFFFSNSTANRNNMDDTGGTNAINGAAPYVNTLDVVLSVDPFTNSAGGNWTLNNTAGGGAAVRAHGTPGTMPGLSQVGYIDGGVLQHQDSGGGGATPTSSAYAQ